MRFRLQIPGSRCHCLSGKVYFCTQVPEWNLSWPGACSRQQGRRWSLAMFHVLPSHSTPKPMGHSSLISPKPSESTSILHAQFLVALATPNTFIRCGISRMARVHGEGPRLLTWSPRICGLLTTSFTRCSTVSVCRVLSAHIRSTRVSWNVLATGTIWQEKNREDKSKRDAQ